MATPNVTPLALLPVGDAGRRPPRLDLEPAAEWFGRVSRGRWRPAVDVLPPVRLPRRLAAYRDAGGMGSPPRNSQQLALDALAALDDEGCRRLAAAGGRLALAVPAGFRPHAWHLPNGGRRVAGVWCRRYAVLPAEAPLGSAVHELAHLLLDWPDLAWDPAFAGECLMARGGLRDGGRDPSPPCAPLLLDAGWRDPLPLERRVSLGQLAGTAVGVVRWGGRDLAVELRRHGGEPRLLLYRSRGSGRTLSPRLVARLPLAGAGRDPSVLGWIAPALRTLPINKL